MSNTKGTSVINAPSGGGAQSGLGEKFSPDLFTGTGNFSFPIAVPPGRNGFQPELTLGYSSGNGNGAFGMGWALGIPGVTRKTSKGIPVYNDETDIFILSGAEDLVPVSLTSSVNGGIGWSQTQFRPRTEGLFAIIIHHKKTNGENYWEVKSKDGLISWYGTPGDTPASHGGTGDPAIVADPQKRDSVFSWHLTKTEDPFGNVILYSYTRDLVVDTSGRSFDQVYVNSIQYAQYPEATAPNAIKYLCEVRFVYEARPDPFSAYKQGFETRMSKRCIKVETYTHDVANTKTKTYHFNYLSELPLNGASLLYSVSVEGHNGLESEFMPPLEFSYSEFKPDRRGLKEITGPIPATLLSEPGYELIDITGNGIPDLLQLNGTARYWTNKGNGEFSQPKNLNIAPSLSAESSVKAEGSGLKGIAFIDANGDGRNDLLVMNNLTAGYFPGAFQKVWDENSFRPYKQAPTFSLDDPEVQLMDLDGDGITDVLRNGSKFECFYNDPEKGFYKVRTALKTFADFSFSDPRIRFADMTGDGLTDIVLISSGRVHYWPNMGYGRFGAKVNMKNAPRFPEHYTPAQILLGDLDGDGQTDIAFVENNSVTIYINQSGNAFSEGTKIMNTPSVRDLKAIRIMDVMGTGQAGILWTLGGSAGTGMYFLDFTKGNKPYVMEQMNNNMGSLTRVSYGSSVYHFLRDQKQPDTRWKTQLPFPVQVVNRVEVYDFLSKGKLVTEYNYHNGYWDGVEREFRGFAHVDSYDTESFDRYNFSTTLEVTSLAITPLEVAGVDAVNYTPPTLTKSWFYVGPVGDGFSRWKEPDFSDEYWSDDMNVLTRPQTMIDLLAALPRRARRDALRTIRGSLLRSELYALDGSALESKPYTVTESLMSLRQEFDPAQQPIPLWNDKNAYWNGGGYVFFPFNTAQRTTQYERGTDPMHNFSFTKEYDAYGQALGLLSVGVPRGLTPAAGMVSYANQSGQAPGNYLATYTLPDYIDPTSAAVYMKNRVKRSRSWDASQSSTNKDIFQLRDAVFANFQSHPVLGCTLNYYDGAGFNGLPYGEIGVYGAQVRSETLIITSGIITDVYGVNTPQCFTGSPNWNTGYPAAFGPAMQDSSGHMGYKAKTGAPYVDGWYAESARVLYDFQSGSLSAAEKVGRVLQSRDVFDAWNAITYDAYLLMPELSTQYLTLYPATTSSLVTQAYYDYRVMQPYQVKDPNLNYSVFDFSPLGLLRATALIGKGTEGDYKSNSGGFYDRYVPSLKMDYDFFAFKNLQDPVWVKTISREQHYVTDPLNDATIVKVEYSDGFGRLLQTRVQAEDVIFGNATFGSSGLPVTQGQNAPAVGIQRGGSDPLNVVVSGWKIYNNKGKVVEQYEPFFDKGFDFSTPLEVTGTGIVQGAGVKVVMFYDPLGRVIKTLNPDNSQAWALYGIPTSMAVSSSVISTPLDVAPSPWINFSYDANDLASITNPSGSNVNPTHYFTPKSSETDALGRTIRTTEYFDNSNYTNTIVMQYSYDVRGNLILVLDPYNRAVFEHLYDLRPAQKSDDGKDQPLTPLWTRHIDKGESRILLDAAAKPIESYDAKLAHALSAYDVISRPIKSWACDAGGETMTLRNNSEYGDSLSGNPENQNLRGKIYQSYDEAGLAKVSDYDFKGNILIKSRQTISDTELTSIFGGSTITCYRVDWTGLDTDILDDKVFQTDIAYDAMNRISSMIYPREMTVTPDERLLLPTYNRAGALEAVEFDGDTYVSQIAYNAKGQRILIAFGNGIMTRYVYDALTFRLLRQRSESFNESSWVYTSTGNVKKDTTYQYDLIGNITNTHDAVTDCGIGGTDDLNRYFEYDAIYRLLSANGRENAPIASEPWDNSYRSDDNTITTAYTQTYSYDKLGNITQLGHSGASVFNRNFNYSSNNNKLNSIAVGATTYSFTYDACGNQLTETSSRKWEWDYGDKPRCFYLDASGSITQYTQYLYDGSGNRVKKLTWKSIGSFDSTTYIDGLFEFRTDGTNEQKLFHVMDNSSRIAMIRDGYNFGDTKPPTLYNLEDQLGSSIVLLGDTGSDVNYEEYFPFGETSFGSYAKKRYRYVGKERDEESGLYYYGARYYAAWTCRFISIDPLAADYAHLSPYNYASNNPITHFDVDGRQTPAEAKSESSNQTRTVKSEQPVPQTQDIKTNNATKDAAKEAMKNAAQDSKLGTKKDIPKPQNSTPKFKIPPTSVLGAVLFLVKGIFSSPPMDDVKQFKGAYHLAESKNFEDKKLNENLEFAANRVDWANVNPDDFSDVYLYRAMETKNGHWIMSDTNVGAVNGRELGARTPASNKGNPDVTPDGNGLVSPSLDSPAGLSANLYPADTGPQMDRIKNEGAIGKISLKTLLLAGLLPTYKPTPNNLGHFVIQPGIATKFSVYQTQLNNLPWQVHQRK